MAQRSQPNWTSTLTSCPGWRTARDCLDAELQTHSPGIWLVNSLRNQSLVVKHCHFLSALHRLLGVSRNKPKPSLVTTVNCGSTADTFSLAVPRPYLISIQSHDTSGSLRRCASPGAVPYQFQRRMKTKNLPHTHNALTGIKLFSQRESLGVEWGLKYCQLSIHSCFLPVPLRGRSPFWTVPGPTQHIRPSWSTSVCAKWQ